MIHMRIRTQNQLRQWKRRTNRYFAEPRVRQLGLLTGSLMAGFCLGGAELGGCLQPFGLGVLCAGLSGWLPMSFALGSCLGYWLFWGQAGLQAVVWIAAGLPVCMTLAQSRKKLPALLPTVAGLIVAVTGLAFRLGMGEETQVGMYLMRICLAFGSTWLFQLVKDRRSPVADWIAMGVAVLALSRIAPLPFLNLGCVAAVLLVLTGPIPMAAIAGLALDLAGVTPVPMTAALCLACLIRMIPWLPRALYPGICPGVYLVMMGLCGSTGWMPFPALALGGVVYLLLPRKEGEKERGSEAGFAQVRLEMVAGVLAQAEQLLREAVAYPMDEEALMARAADRACTFCQYRMDCREAMRIPYLPGQLLHQAVIEPEQLPAACRRKDHLLLELQRGQDQYRVLKADRDRRQEYRTAVMQQYRFLSEYLQDVADHMADRGFCPAAKYEPEVAVCARGKEAVSGDKCLRFAGTENRYYVLLCDGMGTGEGAAYEARTAGNMLRRMLVAGYPARYALRSLNSICVLRGSAGAVTVDLLEADLQTGRATLYKWGAAPSWLLSKAGPEKLGRESPPPGISLEEPQETVDRFSLLGGVPLVMLSDGVDGYGAMGALEGDYDQPAGFLAALILESSYTDIPDDATAAVLRLHRSDRV